MIDFNVREEHELAHTLLLLCQMTKDTDPIAHRQYEYQLNILKDYLMKEFEEEDEDLWIDAFSETSR